MFRYNNSIAATSVATTPGGRLFFQRHAMGAGKDLSFFGGGGLFAEAPTQEFQTPSPLCIPCSHARARKAHSQKRQLENGVC